MYFEKIKDILNDIENKDIDVAGGSIVGIVIANVNSLITYISNLTLGKKKYEDVQNEIKQIIIKAENLKNQALKSIDKDVQILEDILAKYKNRKGNYEDYQNACIKATDFALEVIEIACKTLQLSDEISKVGNKMLASDFKICKYYAKASIESAKENYYINLNSIEDDETKELYDKKLKVILSGYGVE